MRPTECWRFCILRWTSALLHPAPSIRIKRETRSPGQPRHPLATRPSLARSTRTVHMSQQMSLGTIAKFLSVFLSLPGTGPTLVVSVAPWGTQLSTSPPASPGPAAGPGCRRLGHPGKVRRGQVRAVPCAAGQTPDSCCWRRLQRADLTAPSRELPEQGCAHRAGDVSKGTFNVAVLQLR